MAYVRDGILFELDLILAFLYLNLVPSKSLDLHAKN